MRKLIILIGILLNMAAFANAIGNAVTLFKDGTYTETINGWQLGPINRRNVTQSDALTGFKDRKNKLDSNMRLKSGTAHSPIPGGHINLNENDLNGNENGKNDEETKEIVNSNSNSTTSMKMMMIEYSFNVKEKNMKWE